MIADYLSSLGLVLGIVGAWLLYKSLPPAVSRIGAPASDEIVAGKKEQQYSTNAGRGYLLLLLGFLLQLGAMWTPF